MELILDIREATLLKRLLERSLPELREEVYKTENYEWRQELKQDEEVLKSLLQRLEKSLLV